MGLVPAASPTKAVGAIGTVRGSSTHADSLWYGTSVRRMRGCKPPPDNDRVRLPRPRLTSVLPSATAAVLAACWAAYTMRVWDWRPGTPVELAGDGTSVTAWVAAVSGVGSAGVNPHLGAPFGQNLSWWSTGDFIHLSAIKALGWLLAPTDAAAVYFLLGFPLAAATMTWLARRLGANPAAAVCVGVLFAVLPGHQTRYPHLFLASYWTVPISMWLVLAAASGRSIWPSRATGARDRSVGADRAVTVVAVLTTAWSGAYYLVFTLAVLAVVVVLRQLRHLAARPVAEAAVATLAAGALAATTVLLDWSNRSVDQLTGPAPGSRSPMESELFAGRLIDLLLPWTHHRVETLALISQTYRGASLDPPTEEMSLGLVAGIGVLVAIVAAARLALGRRGPSEPAMCGVVAAVAFAFYTKGGLGSVTALFGLASIRAWSRMSVIIAACGLLVVAWVLTQAAVKWRGTTATVICAAVAVVGVLDQTNEAVAPAYAAHRAVLADVRAVTDVLDARLEKNCMVFQAPVITYPENSPRHRIAGYELLLPYVAGSRLRYSYGAMRGTAAADWQLGLRDDDPQRLIDDVTAVGFCALLVNRAGYPATGSALEATARSTVGAPMAEQGDLVAFDLRPRRSQLSAAGVDLTARRDTVLHPVLVRLQATDARRSGQERVYQQVGPSSVLDISALGPTSRGPVAVRLAVRAVGSARTVELQLPDGTTRRADIAPGADTLIDVELTSAPAGRSTVRIQVSGPPVATPTGPDSAHVTIVSAAARDGSRTVVVQEVPPGVEGDGS